MTEEHPDAPGEEATRLVRPDDTVRHSARDTVLSAEETVITSGNVVDDFSQVRVPMRHRDTTATAPGASLLVPGGVHYALHRPVAVGRRPVSPLAPTEPILLLTWDPQDVQVSGTHVLFELSEAGVAVTDLGSANGTRVLIAGQRPRRLGPRETCLVTGEATIEFGRNGKIEIVPAPVVTSETPRR